MATAEEKEALEKSEKKPVAEFKESLLSDKKVANLAVVKNILHYSVKVINLTK
jgi:hypothetical protein